MSGVPLRLLLAGAVLLVFGPAVGHEFVHWDDPIHIYENPHVRTPTAASLRALWVAPHIHLYMPVTFGLWWVLASVSLDPWLFHAANVVVHAVSVWLVWSLLRALLPLLTDGRRLDLAAAAGALLFAVHPLQAEPVAWATGMKDLLCGLFSVAALRAWVAFRSGEAPARRAYALASLAFLAALLAKPAGVVVPLLAWVLDGVVLRRSPAASLRALAPWLAGSAVFALIATGVQPTDESVFRPPLWQRPFVAGDAVAFYLAKLAWPASLGIDPGRTPERVLASATGWLAWLLPAGLLVAASLRARRGDVAWLAALLLFGAALSPVLGLVPFKHQKLSTVADRYAYLAMLGAALAAAVAFARAGRVGRAGVGLVLVALALMTSLQVRTWHDSSSLFAHARRVNPRSVAAEFNLGLLREQRGDGESALRHFLRVVELDPRHEAALYNVGVYRQRAGRNEEAVRAFEAAIAADPTFAVAMVNLGVTRVSMGDLEQGAAWFARALEVEPGLASAATNLAAVRRMQQQAPASASPPGAPGLGSDGPSDPPPESR